MSQTLADEKTPKPPKKPDCDTGWEYAFYYSVVNLMSPGNMGSGKSGGSSGTSGVDFVGWYRATNGCVMLGPAA